MSWKSCAAKDRQDRLSHRELPALCWALCWQFYLMLSPYDNPITCVLLLSPVPEEEIWAQRGLVTFSYHTVPSGRGRIWTEVSLNCSRLRALAPLQHCLLSHFRARETEAQEIEVWVLIKSQGSWGQICAVSITLNKLLTLSVLMFTVMKWVVVGIGENRCKVLTYLSGVSAQSILILKRNDWFNVS